MAKTGSGPRSAWSGGNWRGVEWLAREDPEYVELGAPLKSFLLEGEDFVPAKYREILQMAVLASRGREQAVGSHLKKAIAHGATKAELLRAFEIAAFPGGYSTLVVGVNALMAAEDAGLFRKDRSRRGAAKKTARARRSA